MRIGLLTFEFPGARPGGVGAYTLKAANALAAAGHDAHIFTLTVPAEALVNIHPQVRLHEVPDIAERIIAGSMPPSQGAALLRGGAAIYKLAVGSLLAKAALDQHLETPFDVVEAAEYEALALPLMVEHLSHFPVVTQIHLSSAVNRWANGTAAQPGDEMADALESASILAADGLCAATRSIVNATQQVMALEREVEILPYPISVDAELLPPADDGPILFVGRLLKRKGCEVLAYAANIFLRQHPAARLHLAGGDAPTAAGLSMQASMISVLTADVRDRMIFLGELTGPQLRQELRNCRFVLTPSTVENFANTAADALACGRAVVYGGNTGIEEMVGDAGLCVSPLTAPALAAAMAKLFHDKQLAHMLAQAGRQRAATYFNPEETTARRIAFYNNTIRTFHRCGRKPLGERLVRMPHHAFKRVTEAFLVLNGYRADSFVEESPGFRLRTQLDQLRETLGYSPHVYLFGAGRHTQRLLGERHLWESAGHEISGIIDDHPRFAAGAQFLGLPVQSLEQFSAALTLGLPADAVFLSTDTFEAQWWDLLSDLRAQGVFVSGLYTRRATPPAARTGA